MQLLFLSMKLSENCSALVEIYNWPSATKSIIGHRPITWKLGFGELPITGGNPTRSYLTGFEN